MINYVSGLRTSGLLQSFVLQFVFFKRQKLRTPWQVLSNASILFLFHFISSVHTTWCSITSCVKLFDVCEQMNEIGVNLECDAHTSRIRRGRPSMFTCGTKYASVQIEGPGSEDSWPEVMIHNTARVVGCTNDLPGISYSFVTLQVTVMLDYVRA